MFERDQKLRHLPFFEEVASHEEGDAAWRSATAGLVVLRLVDAWLEEGRSVVADDGWSVRSVRAAIESMDDGTPIRSILDRVVDALHEQKPDIHVVVTPLMAYAKALEYDAKWRLAVDVYHSVLAHLHPVEDGDASIAAHMRLGYCYRSLQQMDAALEAFAAASTIAQQVGDMIGVLLARVNEGHLVALRGNLPKAEEMLDDTIRRAQGAEFQDVRSRAMHTRANIAHFRGDYEFAIRIAYEAFADSASQTQRDRILNDIAISFAELGVFSAARDAYLVLSTTAQEQYMRWLCTINLVEISAKTGAGVLFESYRRQLIGQPLPPYLATAFELHVGLGYRALGEPGKARLHLQRSITLAAEHGINQFLFEAEEALQQVDKRSPPHRVQDEVPLDVREVANAIREMAGAL